MLRHPSRVVPHPLVERNCTPSRMGRTLIVALLMVIGSGLRVDGQESDSASGSDSAEFTDAQLEFFESEVRPLLVEHCYECHGPDASPVEGSLSLGSRKAMITGGDTGPAIVPGHANDSLLIKSIRYNDVYEMPPDTRMSDEKIAILEKWVQQGAPWPAGDDAEVVVENAFDLKQRKADHWAWQPIRRFPPPDVQQEDWPSDPIDRFVLEKLEAAELEPAEPAPRPTLIRRAYFDVIGLPPSPAQVQAFAEDPRPDDQAFADVVDELLASPHFGERWARHWMDLVRYAETYGHEFDYPIPYPHQYRDYLIRAFNADVSYRQLIQEHIAGDLLERPRRHPELDFNESKLGTGFWYFGEAKHGAVDSRGEEAATIDNQIDVMSKTFLGMTVACARCHDHKFDAISTEDYYALAGFLQSSRRERMMLDPGRKIEAAHQAVKSAVERAEQARPEMLAALAEIETDQVANYLSAAAQIAPGRLPPSDRGSVEGESIHQVSVGSGTVEVQTIQPSGKFRWRGNEQRWWRDGKVGDQWVLEFEIPANQAAADGWNLALGLTLARDYGAVRVSVDDVVVADRIDCFAAALASRPFSLDAGSISAGKHQLKFELLQPHADAIPRNMVGMDYLEWIPITADQTDPATSLTRVAAKQGLDEATLGRIVDQLVGDDARRIGHPLYLLRSAVDQQQLGQSIDAAFAQQLSGAIREQTARQQAFLAASELFEDFDQPTGAGWSETGFAFDFGQAASTAPSATGDWLQSPGTISSGSHGSAFQGVLRSPTFELNHGRIHYRIKGHNVTVRLIINGFFMDEYNALLYNGCKFDFKKADGFTWQTQAGDVKNHIGNRAHLEIIDRGDGYVEIDEIRFSDSATPAESTLWSGLAEQISTAASIDDLAKLTANRIATGLQDLAGPAAEGADLVDDANLANWVTRHRLESMLNPTAAGTVSRHDPLKSGVLDEETQTVSVANENVSVAARLDQWSKLREEIVEAASAAPAPMMALGMTDGPGENEHVFIRGNHKNPGPIATRRFLAAISETPIDPADGSGRLKLARKMTAPNNPLASRVAVNRVWHHLLGRGLVESVDNFGVLGKRPSHPELLDYLATQFQQQQWSVKSLIRQVMLSRTYRMSSQPQPATAETAQVVDADNRLLHRANLRRLEGEVIRDAMLAVSGRLDPSLYGPSVPIHLTEFMNGRGRPGSSGPLNGNGRRSVYIAVRRNFLSPMMLAFDTPIPFNTIGRRNQSNVPAQALILMNSPLVKELSATWARQVIERDQPLVERIDSIYQQAFSRPPTAQELEAAEAFFENQAAAREIPLDQLPQSVELWQDFCHVIFNVKEFIYIQ